MIWNQDASSILYGDIFDVLQCMVEKSGKIMSTSAACTEEQKTLSSVALHLIHVLCCVTLTEAKKSTFKQLVCDLVLIIFRTVEGQTFLHRSVKYVLDAEKDDKRISNQPASVLVECLHGGKSRDSRDSSERG